MNKNENIQKRETRYFENQGKPRLREAKDGGESRTIEGYAIVFGVESELIADWCDTFREIIEPGAITADDLAKMDIKMTIWHNRERLLARSDHGQGTLGITVDAVGVKYTFDAPKTPDGDTALELVKRGDLAGSSFIYWSDEQHSVNYTKSDDGVILRHVNKIDQVYDFTIASDPAYSETSVSAREVTDRLGGGNDRLPGQPGQPSQSGQPGQSRECGKKAEECKNRDEAEECVKKAEDDLAYDDDDDEGEGCGDGDDDEDDQECECKK